MTPETVSIAQMFVDRQDQLVQDWLKKLKVIHNLANNTISIIAEDESYSGYVEALAKAPQMFRENSGEWADSTGLDIVLICPSESWRISRSLSATHASSR